jgi:polyhydroxybutyrate depolymerase
MIGDVDGYRDDRVKLFAVLALCACRLDFAEHCTELAIAPAGRYECVVPGWTDRAFGLDVPGSWDGTTPLPVIIVFHGGGGSRIGMNKMTCPHGDESDPACIVAMGNARGYVVVSPDGTGGRPLRGVRTWNAGGGNELQCTSGGACAAKVDDVAYFDDVVDQLRGAFRLDERRIYLTGISNGAAMTHRLACERPDKVAAIAPIAGANQFAADGGTCDGRVPLRHFHGSEDPCWRLSGGAQACLQDDGKLKVDVPASMEAWRTRNGCDASVTETALPERAPGDGTALVVLAWTNCAATTELYRVEGGGHTWPSGQPYAAEDRVGRVSLEVDNADILDFFDAHVHP